MNSRRWDLPAGIAYSKELQSGWNLQSFRPICIPPAALVLLCCTSYLPGNLVITDKNHIVDCWVRQHEEKVISEGFSGGAKDLECGV